MAYLASIVRFGIPASLIALLGAACGGQSFGGDGGEGASGAVSPGGSSQGGSSSTAGKGSAGSTPKAGTSSGGMASGGTASGGSSWGDPACTLPPVSGTCEAYFQSWYHDPSTGICRPFIYGGCGGNANRYESLAACQKACTGGEPNYDACQVPSECVVGGGGCCGVCDYPGLTAHDLIAYNRSYANEVLQCSRLDIACAPCAAPEPGQGSLRYFVPNCVANQCVVQDIRDSAVTACKSNADCRLRNGTGCCEGCGGGTPIAVRNDGSFEKLVCGSEPQPCPACVPAPEPGAVAICGETGHCEVAYLVTAD
jgi:hypothetical protein